MRKHIGYTIGLLALIACGGSGTGPLGLDPAILFNNHLQYPVYLEWRDGQAIVGRDTVAAGEMAHCSHFLAQPDSAYFQIVATDESGGYGPRTSTITAPYFHPLDRPAWRVDVRENGPNSPAIQISLADEMCIETP